MFFLDSKKLLKTFLNILNISSPTFEEQALFKYIKKLRCLNRANKVESRNSLIVSFPTNPQLKNLALVGHLDVVPLHFQAYTKGDKTKKIKRVYGAGASDMKASLAVFLELLQDKKIIDLILKKINLSFIFYAREEGTVLADNGLYDLIKKFPHYFKKIDLAIVGEPTNNRIQLGCLGSLHIKLTIKGLAGHSARPWEGKNALYSAVKLIEKVSKVKPKKRRVSGVSYFDVLEMTESQCEKGITTVPGWWEGNINYRFAPDKDTFTAKKYIRNFFSQIDIPKLKWDIFSQAPAGKVVSTPLLQRAIKQFNVPVEAKQAWTDVAQFSKLNIPAFNFGPGLTEQCHKNNEYASFPMLLEYSQKLIHFLANG